MKIRSLLAILLVTGRCSLVPAQEADTLMKLVLQDNRELKVARQAYQVALLEAGTGNTPPDPELEFAYLFGKPDEMGNRVDFGVRQQLDFPTAYMHRSRLKKIRSSQAELRYILTRQEVLLEARQLWIEQIYLNKLRKLLSERLLRAKTILAHVEHLGNAGEVSFLEISQTSLLVASLEAEAGEVASEMNNNRMALKEITGGTPPGIYDTLLPVPVRILPDSVLEAYRQGPHAELYDQGLQRKEVEKNLAVSYHLPRLSAGYYSESVLDQVFSGFRLGVSVPLWENANTVKKAQAEVVHAEAEKERYFYKQEREIRQKLNELETLRSRVKKLEDALESANSMALLETVLQSGEISFSEYFYSSDFYFRNQQLLLRYSRDLLIQEAELMKIYL